MTEQIYFTQPDQVIVLEDRTRREFDPKELRQLAESIKKRRQDTPGICYHNKEGKPVLVFGERRLRACALVDHPFAYRLQEYTNEFEMLEMEVEENTHRANLTWLEEDNAIAHLQDVKKQIYGGATQGKKGWGTRETAEFVGKSVGATYEAIELSRYAEALPEVANAKNRTEAKKIVKRIEADLKRSKALEKAKKSAEEADFDKDISDLEKQILFYEKKVHCGDFTEILPSLDKKYDLVICDPPWGVDYDQVKEASPEQEDFTDNPEHFQTNLLAWLENLYDHMSENSHLYLFFGIVNHEFIHNTLEQVGFSTNRIPLIWYKQGAHRTRNPDIWPGRSYEPIAFARKGRKKIIKLGAPDVIITPAPTPTLKKIHPSAKHPLVYLELIQRSALPGDKLLDPMCGSGMLGPAAEVLRTTHQLDWDEIDINQRFCNLAIDNAVKGLYQIFEKKEETLCPTQ